MSLIRYLVGITSILISGYCLLKSFNVPKSSRLETLALCFGLGAVYTGLSMFFLSLTTFPLSFDLIILPQLALVILVLWVRRRQFSLNNILHEKLTLPIKLLFFDAFLAGIIFFELLFVVVKAGSLPFTQWDAWCNWGFKANIVFHDKTFSIAQWLLSPNIPHMNYPLLLSLQEAYIYFFIGEINESYAAIFCSFYFVATVLLFFGVMRRSLPRRQSLIMSFFLSTTPIFLFESTRGYADIPLAFYIFLAIINLWNFIDRGERQRLWLSAIFFGCAMWIKNEGISFWLSTSVALLLSRLIFPNPFSQIVKLKMFIVLLVVPPLIYSPWIFLRIFAHICNEVPFKPFQTLLPLIAERGPALMGIIFSEISDVSHWNIVWFIFFSVAFIMILRRRKKEFFLALVVFLHMIFISAVFIFSASSLAEMREWCFTSIQRPWVQVYPVMMLFIAYGVHQISTKTNQEAQKRDG